LLVWQARKIVIDPALLGCDGERQTTEAKAEAKATAGPSTPFGAKNAPNYAQDDRFVVVLSSYLTFVVVLSFHLTSMSRLPHLDRLCIGSDDPDADFPRLCLCVLWIFEDDPIVLPCGVGLRKLPGSCALNRFGFGIRGIARQGKKN
jgi:hypothetical protein